MKVELENDLTVQELLNRAILVKDFIEMWAEADSLEGLHEILKTHLHLFEPYRLETCFKFLVKSFGKTYSPREQVDIINTFGYTDHLGPTRMKDPEIIYGVFVNRAESGKEHYYFGRYLGRSLRGKHIESMNLKKREYLGTTSMDAELSLVMSNMGLAREGSFIYDPFVGTGSFLYTCSYFGAYTMGSDIDGRQMRGKLKTSTPHRGPKYKKSQDLLEDESQEFPSIFTNVRQYNLSGLVLDCLVFDLANHPLRSGALKFSAIVTDPPYGVRAGAKKLGAASPKDSKPIPLEFRAITYPTTQPYALDEMLLDLYEFACNHLIPQGRLVFWYPVDVDLVESFDLQQIIRHDRLNFVAASLDHCKGFDRWLITLELK